MATAPGSCSRSPPSRDIVVDALLPENTEDEIDDLHVVLMAQKTAEALQDGSAVEIVDDQEIIRPVVEIVGPSARVSFPCNSSLRHLVLHVRHLDKFVSLEIQVVDALHQYRTLQLSTRRTIAVVSHDRAEVPMYLQDGWQLVCIDLAAMIFRAFGTDYLATVGVRVGANCRLAKVFFASEQYADAELPVHLRVLESEARMGSR